MALFGSTDCGEGERRREGCRTKPVANVVASVRVCCEATWRTPCALLSTVTREPWQHTAAKSARRRGNSGKPACRCALKWNAGMDCAGKPAGAYLALPLPPAPSPPLSPPSHRGRWRSHFLGGAHDRRRGSGGCPVRVGLCHHPIPVAILLGGKACRHQRGRAPGLRAAGARVSSSATIHRRWR